MVLEVLDFLVISVLVQDLCTDDSMLPMVCIIITFILSLCRSVSTSLLPCNILYACSVCLLHVAGSADH